MDVLFLVNVFRFYSELKFRFTKNTVRKNLFLCVCHCLDENIPLHEMDQEFPFGGLIGYGDSHLDKIFRFSKVFRLHAIYMTLPALFIYTTAKYQDTVI